MTRYGCIFLAILSVGCTTTTDQWGSHQDLLTFGGRQKLIQGDPREPVHPSRIAAEAVAIDPAMGALLAVAEQTPDPAQRADLLQAITDVAGTRSGSSGRVLGPSGAYGTSASSPTADVLQRMLVVNKQAHTCILEINGQQIEVPAGRGHAWSQIAPGRYHARIYAVRNGARILTEELYVDVDEIPNNNWAFVGPSATRVDADYVFMIE